MSPKHPILETGFIKSLEALLRLKLQTSERAREALLPLQGKVISLTLTPLNRSIHLCPGESEVLFLTELSTPSDLTLRGNLASFLKASSAGENPHALKSSGLMIVGPSELAARFQAFAKALEIDWQVFLSRYLGYTVTHQVLETVGGLKRWLHGAVSSLESDLSEYLQEESRLLPGALEVDRFHLEIDQLRASTDRLKARLDRLSLARRT